ncbi:GumC family protein [Mucilaginibacter phyllosphaerae]|uniref:non-specific protein-tyrosine kinase n=1 Tax=Mucilaginibacter phyllosphaerae TaxID=1812349 RepID=A0A4Y8A9P4_9SPHI|nr:tyrosine-protein kinase family protein [Mucilaginibacter phyllosphaerae]MBB3970519.1 capsular exopolysaccharide synthesis family protein [Mucilaginibacter phyllosphaerae]TEW64533.1 polysaccharide biosynthesis tyrosine autokinase [Mucilaginibacter phyllosphaerae]GGH19289.1 tyrosine protein kinase [Mucilaginibacter phyllosphaerae]
MNKVDILADKLDFTYKKAESGGDLRSIIAIGLNYWYVFVISVAICLFATFIYVQRLPNKWNVVSKIIVEDDKNSPAKSLTGGSNGDLASLLSIKSNADNEVKILKSSSLLKKVIAALQLNVHLYKHTGYKDVEIYNNAPFTAFISNKQDSVASGNFKITILNDKAYHLQEKKGDLELDGVFGRPVKLDGYTLTLNKTPWFKSSGDFELAVETIKKAERTLSENYNVLLDDKQATVIDLQLSYNNPKKGEQILQKMMEIYLADNLTKKIRIADSTMKFIDNRLVVVGSELNKVEKSLEQYKVKNKISDIGAQAKALVAGAEDYQDKLNANQVQLDVVNNLYRYVNDGNNPQVVPTSLVIKDVSFGTAINAYNEMLLRKEQLKLTLLETSPVIQNLDEQIKLSRKSLLTGLKNYRNSLQVSQSAFKRQNSVIAGNMSEAPVKERIYLDYSRQQSLKQELYLFLLQKREETAIAQTATISNCSILDNAESDEAPYTPKIPTLYLIGSFIGLFIAVTGLCIKEMLNIRINTKSDIVRHTDVPLLGEISRGLHNNSRKLLSNNDAHSIILEEIRALRTGLRYVTDKGKSNVILFTSSMSGEGKSFISLNLGNSIALSGKKVVLLELDLRKPKLMDNLGLDEEYGFTNFVISQDKDCIDTLIKPSTFNDNFFFISSGPIPPNPAELLMSDRLKTLIEELRNRFDYVIIDSAPVGLASDALLIEEYADITCYVVRQNYTYKSQLGIVNDLYKEKKVKQLYLIVNGIETSKNNITGYGHGYESYGYAMEENRNNNVFSSVLNKLRPGTR